MRPIAMMQAQFKADTKEGESLHFEACKGGYFSDVDEYGLKVVGKTFQDGTPTPDAPIGIQCVKSGTRIICGNEITTPCDLYEGDIWYPATGKVERYTSLSTIDRITAYLAKKYDEYVWFSINGNDVPGIKPNAKIWCKLFPCKNTWWFEGYAIQPHLTGNSAYFSLRYSDLGEGYNKDTDDTTLYNAGTNWINENNFDVVYELSTPVLEQYDPQSVYVQGGTVNVEQESIGLPAGLRATMLVRR